MKILIENMTILLKTDPDFIAIKRFDYSLEKLVDRYPEGCPKHIICKAFLMAEAEIDEVYNAVLDKLRKTMKV